MKDNFTFNFKVKPHLSRFSRDKEGEIHFDPPEELGGTITHKQAIMIREVLLLGCGITQASVAIGYSPSYLSQGLNVRHSTWPIEFQEWINHFVSISKLKRLKNKQKIEAFENWKKTQTKALKPLDQAAEEDSLSDISSEEAVRMQVILTKRQRDWLRLRAYEEETKMSKIVRRLVNEAMNESTEALRNLVKEQAEEINKLQDDNIRQRLFMHRTKHLINALRLEQERFISSEQDNNND